MPHWLDERSATAYHESGHALIACRLGYRASRVEITSVLSGVTGSVAWEPGAPLQHHRVVLVAGAVSVALAGGDHPTITRSLGQKDVPEWLGLQPDPEAPIATLLRRLADDGDQAARLLGGLWSGVDGLASILARRGRADGDDVRRCARNAHPVAGRWSEGERIARTELAAQAFGDALARQRTGCPDRTTTG